MNSISNSLAAGDFASVHSKAEVLQDRLSMETDFSQQLKDLNESEAEAEELGKEFESMFVSLLLKEMRNTLDQGDGGLFGSEQSDTFGGMFDQFMGKHLADSSPLGLAEVITGDIRKRMGLPDNVQASVAIESYRNNQQSSGLEPGAAGLVPGSASE